MAIANGTCVSFCNQPKAQFRYLRRVTPVCQIAFTRFAGGCIWLPQESLRHILASPGYVPGTIAVNVKWMERGFNAGQSITACTHLSSTVYELGYSEILVGNGVGRFLFLI